MDYLQEGGGWTKHQSVLPSPGTNGGGGVGGLRSPTILSKYIHTTLGFQNKSNFLGTKGGADLLERLGGMKCGKLSEVASLT